MKGSNPMFDDLLAYEDLHEACGEMFGFGGVTLKRDFGPWKAGENLPSLWFNLEKAIVEEQSDEGNILRSCKFQLVAVDV